MSIDFAIIMQKGCNIMKILFSPSESKSKINSFQKINKEHFLYPDLWEQRAKALNIYQNYIKKADDNSLMKIFGIKKRELLEDLKQIDIFNNKTQKAVLRYDGVGYTYLSYKTLNDSEKDFIDNNMIIFSNLFGPILAKTHIPYYKLKQGEKIGDFSFEKHYKYYFQKRVDEFLKDGFIVDLRASFYEKMYLPSTKYWSFKFVKDAKVVSHWAKAYRGKVARELAKYQPQNEKELMSIEFEGLKTIEIKNIKNKTELVFEII